MDRLEKTAKRTLFILWKILRFPKWLINKLYWFSIWEVSLYWRFNWTPIIVNFQKWEVKRLYVWKGGKIENVFLEGWYMDQSQVKELIALYEWNIK